MMALIISPAILAAIWLGSIILRLVLPQEEPRVYDTRTAAAPESDPATTRRGPIHYTIDPF